MGPIMQFIQILPSYEQTINELKKADLHPCSFKEQPKLLPPNSFLLYYSPLADFFSTVRQIIYSNWSCIYNCRLSLWEWLNKTINPFLRGIDTISRTVVYGYKISQKFSRIYMIWTLVPVTWTVTNQLFRTNSKEVTDKRLNNICTYNVKVFYTAIQSWTAICGRCVDFITITLKVILRMFFIDWQCKNFYNNNACLLNSR